MIGERWPAIDTPTVVETFGDSPSAVITAEPRPRTAPPIPVGGVVPVPAPQGERTEEAPLALCGRIAETPDAAEEEWIVAVAAAVIAAYVVGVGDFSNRREK